MLPHHRRGVSLEVLLGNCGEHLYTDFANEFADAEVSYRISQPVAVVNDFISHPWSAPGGQKWRALCLMYNSQAAIALVCLLLPAMVVARLLLRPSLPSPDRVILPWCLLLVAPVFIAAVLHGHKVRGAWKGSSRAVFLDTLCIHQGDANQKQEATSAMAAIVAQSDRLILLWSPQYFERMWCVLEVAAIIIGHKQKIARGEATCDPLVFVSLFATESTFQTFFAMFVCCVALYMVSSTVSQAAQLLLVVSMGFYLFYVARRHVAEHDKLMRQLEHFDVMQAKCSQARDHEILTNTIVHWFGSLERFETHVKTEVILEVDNSLHQGPSVPLRSLAIGFLPGMLSNIDTVLAQVASGDLHPFAGIVFYLELLLLYTLMVSFFLKVAGLTHRLGQQCPQCSVLLDCLGGLFGTAVGIVALLVVGFTVHGGAGLMASNFAILLCLVVLTRLCKPRLGTKPLIPSHFHTTSRSGDAGPTVT